MPEVYVFPDFVKSNNYYYFTVQLHGAVEGLKPVGEKQVINQPLMRLQESWLKIDCCSYPGQLIHFLIRALPGAVHANANATAVACHGTQRP